MAHFSNLSEVSVEDNEYEDSPSPAMPHGDMGGGEPRIQIRRPTVRQGDINGTTTVPMPFKASPTKGDSNRSSPYGNNPRSSSSPFYECEPRSLATAADASQAQFALSGLARLDSLIVEVVSLRSQMLSENGISEGVTHRYDSLTFVVGTIVNCANSNASAMNPPMQTDIEMFRNEWYAILDSDEENYDTGFLVESAKRISHASRRATASPTLGAKFHVATTESPKFPIFFLIWCTVLLVGAIVLLHIQGESSKNVVTVLIIVATASLWLSHGSFFRAVKARGVDKELLHGAFSRFGTLLFSDGFKQSHVVIPNNVGGVRPTDDDNSLMVPMMITNPLLPQPSDSKIRVQSPSPEGKRSVKDSDSFGDHLTDERSTSVNRSNPLAPSSPQQHETSSTLLRTNSTRDALKPDYGSNSGTFGLPRSLSMTLAQRSGVFETPDGSDAAGDNITIFVPGFDHGIEFDVQSIHDRVIMIVTDTDSSVIYWNEGARIATGFAPEDVMNRHFDNFIAQDSSAQIVQRMRQGASSYAPVAAKTLSLISATTGLVSVRGTVAAATSEGSIVGHVLIASELEDSAQRMQSMLHQWVLDDLETEIKAVELNTGLPSHEVARNSIYSDANEGMPMEGSRRSSTAIGILLPPPGPSFNLIRAASILTKFKWGNMNGVATAVVDWSSTSVQGILEDTLRNRHQFFDVKVIPGVPNEIVCDQYIVGPALANLMSGVAGKCRMEINVKETKQSISQMIITIQMVNRNHKLNVQRIKSAAVALLPVCGDCVPINDQTAHFSFPYLNDMAIIFPAGAIDGDSLSTSRQDGAPVTTKSPFPITVLVVEKSPVYRQNIILSLMPLGHLFSWAESPIKALNILERNADEYSAIIIDLDQSPDEVRQLIQTVSEEYPKVCVVYSSEHPRPDTLKKDALFLSKPIQRELVEVAMAEASRQGHDRKEKEEAEAKQIEVLKARRTLPWKKGKLLGSGAFASVYECEAEVIKAKMAVKMIRLKSFDADDVARIVNEVRILTQLSHPHVITYLYCERGSGTLNLFMELATQGTLGTLLSKAGGMLSEAQMAAYTKQLLSAIQYLHDQGIVHRDIKPANVLVTEGNVLKLSDFGTATSDVLNHDTSGTLLYMAPEILDEKVHGKECDIFSLGCVICECFNIRRVAGAIPKYDDLPTNLSAPAKQFIVLCMKPDPADRPSAGTLLMHDFIVEHSFGGSMSLQRIASKSRLRKPSLDQWTAGGAASDGAASSGTPSW